jgi:hypothetical protein
MRETPTLRIEIEGHTCNIGTAEYNLALGNRRATAVKEYLVSRGITEDRLRTVSYGEERPKYDNAREETRRLNRRGADGESQIDHCRVSGLGASRLMASPQSLAPTGCVACASSTST